MFFSNHFNNYEPSLSNKFNNILAIDKGPCIDDPCVQQCSKLDMTIRIIHNSRLKWRRSFKYKGVLSKKKRTIIPSRMNRSAMTIYQSSHTGILMTFYLSIILDLQNFFHWYIQSWKLETTDTASSASFLDLYLEFDDSGQFSTKIYDKRDDFNFKIINFPNMCSNIPASPAYGVYISKLIRYRHLHMRNRLLDQGYTKIRLIRSLKKFIFRYQDLVEIYSVSAETIIGDAFSYSEKV